MHVMRLCGRAESKERTPARVLPRYKRFKGSERPGRGARYHTLNASAELLVPIVKPVRGGKRDGLAFGISDASESAAAIASVQSFSILDAGS